MVTRSGRIGTEQRGCFRARKEGNEMNKKYDFRRSFYYDVEKSVKYNKVTFILGARKCGKTVCMRQLADAYGEAEYYDLKSMDEDAAVDLRDSVVDSIRRNEKKIYLIDEATYFIFPEKTIARIASEFSSCVNSNTRVVFAGSQSIALEAWANRAFAGNAEFVYADFLSYPEWLAYKGMTEVSEETYNSFLFGVREFYGDFVSLDQYLKGCLEETVVSNYKTSNIIFHNECDRLNVQILKNMLYAALVAQEDRPDIMGFFDKDKVFREIRNSFKDAYKLVGSAEVQRRVDEIFAGRLGAYSALDMETFRQGLVFLYRSGLITLTHVTGETEDFSNIIDVYMDLQQRDGNRIQNKKDLFEKVNICIKYPLFYVEILKEVLQENMPSRITGDILGGIVECHTRGILPQSCQYEYHNNGREVDYVNYAERKAVEITVRNKSARELSFSDLPDSFSKILLTKDQDYVEQDGLVRIPYYRFIFDNSVGKGLFPKPGHEYVLFNE